MPRNRRSITLLILLAVGLALSVPPTASALPTLCPIESDCSRPEPPEPPIIVDPLPPKPPVPPDPNPPAQPPPPPLPPPPPPPQPTLTVVRIGPGSGVVTGGPISCGGACSAEGGSQITLIASADANNAFAGWGGACSGDSPRCTVTLDADKKVTAEFRPIRDRVAVSTNGNGNVTSSSPGVDCGSKCAGEFVRGSTISLTAAPGPDSFFGGWTGACSGSNPTCSLPVNGTATVTANFVKATLKLRRAAFQVSWKLSKAEGTLVLAGAVNGSAELKLTLSGRMLDKLPQSDVAAGAPGNFRRVLPLPAGLLPGRYTLDVSGRIGGVAVARRKVIILRAPASGVVSEASASSTATGQAFEALSASSTEMWARFTFAAQPKPVCFLKRTRGRKVRSCRSPQLTVTWIKPDGTLAVAPQAMRPGANVAAGVSATPPIDAGTWTVTLMVGSTAVCELKFVVNR